MLVSKDSSDFVSTANILPVVFSLLEEAGPLG